MAADFAGAEPAARIEAEDGAEQAEVESSDTAPEAAEPGSTVVYGQEFIARYPNAVSVLDLVRRIPAGQRILDASANQGARGFSANTDLILINGKRLTGKSNDSESALGRITVDQVKRIEIIRGSSPDIKVSSQEGILNIVTNGTAPGGSGSWRADTRIVRGLDADPGGFLSYGSSLGALDYFVSAELVPLQRKDIQREDFFGPDGQPTGRLDETIPRDERELKFAANLSYAMRNGDTLRLNGSFTDSDVTNHLAGVLSAPDGMGGFVATGTSRRIESDDIPEWEIGGDYEAALGEALKFKLLGLYSRTDFTFFQAEDFLITGPEPEDDIRITTRQEASEAVGRTSLTWDLGAAHDLEFGTEVALNEVASDLEFLRREGGVLVPQPVDAANVTVEETRNESFVIHSWKLSGRMSLDSQLYTEYSRISQKGANIDLSKTLFFLRPSFDYRFNVTAADQLQVSLRRRVEQLNFGDFASSASQDDQVVGGNADLEPWKSWDLEVSFEHRLAGDGGRLKLITIRRWIEDWIERIEVSPGISGVGNVGPARIFRVTAEASLRLGFLGLPNVLIEPRYNFLRSRVVDPFTGQRRIFSGWNNNWGRMSFRHDVSSLGLSYGGEVARYGRWTQFDIDERIEFPHRVRLDLFAEKTIFAGIILRLDVENLNDRQEGRTRLFFADGVATGTLSQTERRDRRLGRWYTVSLRGTF